MSRKRRIDIAFTQFKGDPAKFGDDNVSACSYIEFRPATKPGKTGPKHSSVLFHVFLTDGPNGRCKDGIKSLNLEDSMKLSAWLLDSIDGMIAEIEKVGGR